jgi:hypothetical protein
MCLPPAFDLCFRMVFIPKPIVLVGRITVFLQKESICEFFTQSQHVHKYIKETLPKITQNTIALLPVLNKRDSFSCTQLNISVTALG